MQPSTTATYVVVATAHGGQEFSTEYQTLDHLLDALPRLARYNTVQDVYKVLHHKQPIAELNVRESGAIRRALKAGLDAPETVHA